MSDNRGEKMHRAVTDLNRKFAEQATQRKAATAGLPYFDLTGFPVEQEALQTVPKDLAEESQAIPFYREGHELKIGAADPGNPSLKKLLELLARQKYQLEVYLVSVESLAEALKQYKKVAHFTPREEHEIIARTESEAPAELKKTASEWDEEKVSLSELLGLLIGAAITMGASDIHLEPGKEKTMIRFRVDGVLQDIATLPKPAFVKIVSRIKLLAALKLNVTATPQDGRFAAHMGKKALDLRVSMLPSAYGESVVIRILGIGFQNVKIQALGFEERAGSIIAKELAKPNGMILTTGPTGSGKTTTLYAFLNHLNKPGVKIITLEDPVEYEVSGITQTPIDKSAGMDFAKGLRSILRQDPDIVMVGEIRDFETAETAAQAALTGHVVLSTLHTNDAAGAIPRLLDMGVKPVTLAPALNVLMAQRLLRRICQDCKEMQRPEQKELARIKMILSQVSERSGAKVPDKLIFYHSKGCTECHDLGYRGRIGVFEVLPVDDNIEKLIYQQASTLDIKKAAVSAGMLTMQQDAILKALQGLTDLSEVWRVTEE